MTIDNPGRRRILLGGAMLAAAPAIATVAFAQQRSSDPLASWNEGAAKKSITDFVARVTTKGSPDFVAPAARIATFDNDGTLWSEQPMYFQLAFAFERLAAITGKPPDMKEIMAGGEKALLEVVAKTHSGITTDEFNKVVSDWLQDLHRLGWRGGIHARVRRARVWHSAGAGDRLLRRDQVPGRARRQAGADEGAEGRVHR
jgi:hypothetical protein